MQCSLGHRSLLVNRLAIGSTALARIVCLTHRPRPSRHRSQLAASGSACGQCGLGRRISVRDLSLEILRLYRVAQKVVNFSTHHIFGNVQDKMKRISPKRSYISSGLWLCARHTIRCKSFIPRNSTNTLVKSVSFYLQWLQRYGVLKNVQLFGPFCILFHDLGLLFRSHLQHCVYGWITGHNPLQTAKIVKWALYRRLNIILRPTLKLQKVIITSKILEGQPLLISDPNYHQGAPNQGRNHVYRVGSPLSWSGVLLPFSRKFF